MAVSIEIFSFLFFVLILICNGFWDADVVLEIMCNKIFLLLDLSMLKWLLINWIFFLGFHYFLLCRLFCAFDLSIKFRRSFWLT
jgi:hypothetical protein